MTRLATRLSEADHFVALAAVVCEECEPAFAIRRCVVTLHDAGTTPVVIVDNFPAIDDEDRVQAHTFLAHHPLHRAMVEHLGPAGDDCMYFLPILAPRLVGSIQLGQPEHHSRELQRDLATMATQVSARFAQLGIAPVPLETRGDAHDEIAGVAHFGVPLGVTHLSTVTVTRLR